MKYPKTVLHLLSKSHLSTVRIMIIYSMYGLTEKAISDCPQFVSMPPEGKKLSYDIGRIKQTVRITDPLTVVHAQWIDSSTPDYDPLGDVNSDGVTDIEDAVAVIQYINGMTPLRKDEEKRADVTKDKTVDIDDAVTIISYINGNITF